MSDDDDVAEAEIVEGPTTADVTAGDLVPVEHSALTRTAAPITDIADVFTDHVKLVERIVGRDDWQTIQGKQFLKKSGLRKLATAYGVSAQIVDRSTVCDEQGRVVRSEFVVRAVAPNGRTMDGFGSCDLTDKCGQGKNKADCLKPDHDPRSHFSHPNHDIPATAETRAKNRAFSDLFAMGQVTAEEVGDPPQWEALGWPSEAGFRNLMEPLHAALAASDGLRAEWKAWRKAQGIGWPVENAHARDVRIWMQQQQVGEHQADEFSEDRPAELQGPDREPGTGGQSSTPAAPQSPSAGQPRGGRGDAKPNPARAASPPPTSEDRSGKPTKAQLARLAILCNEIAATTLNTADLDTDAYRHAVIDAVTGHRVQSASAATKREVATAITAAMQIQRGELLLDVTGEKGQLAELLPIT